MDAIIVKQGKLKVIITCVLILLISGCTSETPQPTLIRFDMNGQPVNCIKYENALSCDFKPPSTTTTIIPIVNNGDYDGCDRNGCYLIIDGIKEYVAQTDSTMPQYKPTTTTSTTIPEGLLDFRKKFHRFIGK